jgi:hypothetical protein
VHKIAGAPRVRDTPNHAIAALAMLLLCITLTLVRVMFEKERSINVMRGVLLVGDADAALVYSERAFDGFRGHSLDTLSNRMAAVQSAPGLPAHRVEAYNQVPESKHERRYPLTFKFPAHNE